jgi:3'-5' exonuclease
MRALTIERALAQAHKAGCMFRLAGAEVRVRGLDRVSPFVADFLRENREAVFTALGGSEHDRPCLELLEQLGIELVYCTDDDSAEAAIAEVLTDAGDKPVALDIETTPRQQYASPAPLKLTVRGRLMKVQPRRDDKAGLDPHRSEPRLVQLYGGGSRVAVLDMQVVSWGVLAPLWNRPLVAHNAAFELGFLARRGIHPRAQCSMQAAGLLLGVRRRSLAEACAAYLGVTVPKAHQTSDWAALTLSRGQLAYGLWHAAPRLSARPPPPTLVRP